MKNDYPNGQPTGSPRSAIAEPPALSESLRHFRNQAPSESLGLPSGNNLAKPFLQATVVTAVIFALLTVGPYLMSSATPATDTKAPAEATPAGESPKTTTPPVTVTPSPDTLGKGSPVSTGGKGDIVEKLKENGTKTAPPKVNPLDKKEDDILKDIK